MTQTTSHHFSIAIFGRRIELTDQERTRTKQRLMLAIALLATALFVLLSPGLPSPFNLACGAAIFSCAALVLSHGAKRSIRLAAAALACTKPDRLGNLALVYVVLFALTMAVIVAEIMHVLLAQII